VRLGELFGIAVRRTQFEAEQLAEGAAASGSQGSLLVGFTMHAHGKAVGAFAMRPHDNE
jgi:hypothetical protein